MAEALTHIVDMAVKQSEGWDNDIVMITHGDCKEDAEFVARQVEKKMGVHNILINCIGTVIGSHTGPGVVAVFCMVRQVEIRNRQSYIMGNKR